jgi:2,3-bisphosphoglycerate-independent phosphoglycerate mutase
MRKVLLVILDGWGHSDFEGEPTQGNAVELASVPRFRHLYETCPRTRLECSGTDVGLPNGQMGNSEVGHLNLGAGRVVHQDIARIDHAIAENEFASALNLNELVQQVRDAGSKIHVVGLVSDGGVHSHLRHFLALFDLLPKDIPIRVHCVTDGRDTSPTGGADYLAQIETACSVSEHWSIASVCGRYWVMDRDRRWDRTRKGYDLIVSGQAEVWADDLCFMEQGYASGVTDEFVLPTGIRGVGEEGVSPDDVVILMNFRADRMRQLVAALSRDDFDEFKRPEESARTIVSMTEYEEGLPVTVAFPTDNVPSGLSEHLSSLGKRQLKVAETEKYAHVTYFFNGGEEAPFMGEDRSLVPSPRVATYDLQPEMSARGVTQSVIAGLRDNYDFILVNYANPDMVGHTGVLSAAIKAVETVDQCLAEILAVVDEHPEWVVLVTADHGNCEEMIDSSGRVQTAHTTTPVDLMFYDPLGGDVSLAHEGRLGDVAPTVLGQMNIDPPPEMTGRDLVTGQVMLEVD